MKQIRVENQKKMRDGESGRKWNGEGNGKKELGVASCYCGGTEDSFLLTKHQVRGWDLGRCDVDAAPNPSIL